MGAAFTEQRAEGKTPNEAYRNALADARDYYGHQEGYSGAINSKDGGFVKVNLPPRFTYAKLLDLFNEYEDITWRLHDAREAVRDWTPGGWRNESGKVRGHKGQLARAQRELLKARQAMRKLESRIPPSLHNFENLYQTFNDKWAEPLCVELPTSVAKPSKRGYRVYVFFGYAPS